MIVIGGLFVKYARSEQVLHFSSYSKEASSRQANTFNMPRQSVLYKTGRAGYYSRRSKYGMAIKAARAAVLSNRRLAPPRTGGFWGVRQRVRGNELNTIDVDSASYVADTTGTITLLNGVATGDDFTDRTGRKIVMKSLYIRGLVKNVDISSGPCLCRLLVVYDNQANGAAPVILDVLKEATSTSQFNLNNRDRFRIIMDKQYAIGAIDNTATQAYAAGPSIQVYKLYKKINLETIFSGVTNAIASIQTGSVYVITIGDQAANAGGTFKFTTRIRFVDK